MSASAAPWNELMSDDRFDLMGRILAAPSPIGLEAAMTRGVLEPHFRSFMPDSWAIHSFKGNAGIVVDTAPDAKDAFSVLVIGHADKIRMQVRSIGDDGKIWINCDSMLPTTLIGHKVKLFSEDPDAPGSWRTIEGGTIEALGAIHFANPDVRAGKSGIKAEMLYLELLIHGEDKQKQIEALGIRAGDPILYDRPIERGFSPGTFGGAYLDNGLGCFVVAEIARLLAESSGLKNVRFLGGIASHEEIGRFGSRVQAETFRPDVTIAVDVTHDLVAAPGVDDKRYEPTAMGKGCTLTHGAITSAALNTIVTMAAKEKGIPLQHEFAGRDTGTDAMAAVLASVDSAAASIGFPIRNMHTISESGYTPDIDAAIYAIVESLQYMDRMNNGAGITADDLRTSHPRLDGAAHLTHREPKS